MTALVWERTVLRNPDQVRYSSGQYVIYTDEAGGKSVLSSGHPDYFGPNHTETLTKAQAQAENHARAKARRAGAHDERM